MTADDQYLAMRQIVANGVAQLSESRRVDWKDAVDSLERLVVGWYREELRGRYPTDERPAASAS